MKKTILCVALVWLGCAALKPSESRAEVLVRSLRLGQKVSQRRRAKGSLHVYLIRIRKKGFYLIEASKVRDAQCILYRRAGWLLAYSDSGRAATCRLVRKLPPGKYAFQLELRGQRTRSAYRLRLRKTTAFEEREYWWFQKLRKRGWGSRKYLRYSRLYLRRYRHYLRQHKLYRRSTFLARLNKKRFTHALHRHRMLRSHGRQIRKQRLSRTQRARLQRQRKRYREMLRAGGYSAAKLVSLWRSRVRLSRRPRITRYTASVRTHPSRRLHNSRQFHYYSLHLNRGGFYVISINRARGNVDPECYLFKNGRPIHYSDDEGPGLGCQWKFFLPPGRYEIRVMSNPLLSNRRGTYRLIVQKKTAYPLSLRRASFWRLRHKSSRYPWRKRKERIYAFRLRRAGIYRFKAKCRTFGMLFQSMSHMGYALFRGETQLVKEFVKPMRARQHTRYLEAGLYHLFLETQYARFCRISLRPVRFLRRDPRRRRWPRCTAKGACCKIIARRRRRHELRCTRFPTHRSLLLFVDNRYQPQFQRRGAHYVLRHLYRKRQPKRLLFLLPGHRRMSVPLARLFRRRRGKGPVEFSLPWTPLRWRTPWPKSRRKRR